MTSHDSWSIPGVDWETREAAREAARRSGLPVAEWLEEVVAEQGAGRDKPARIPGNRRRARRQVAREIERLQSELDALDDETPDRDVSSIAGAVASLAGRTAGGESETRSMVARLAEQLADIAEAGKNGRNSPAENRPDPQLAQIADALRRARERSQPALADQTGSPRRDADERREILENLRDRVEALRSDGGRATQPGQAAPSTARVAELNRTISKLRERLEAIRNGAAGAAPSGPSAGTAKSDETAPESAPVFDLKRAIAEIAARQETLDRIGLTRSASATPERDPLPDFDFDFGDLSREPSSEKADLSQIQAELARLDRAAATIDAGPSSGSSELAAIRAELKLLRAGLDETARESSVQSLEAGYVNIIERLDTMNQVMPDRDRIEELAGAISQLGRALAHSESERDLSRLEAQIATVADAIDELASRGVSPALDRRLEEIGETIEGLQDFGRLSEKEAERRHGKIEALIGALPSGGLRNETLERVDQRLAEVAERIDAALSASTQASLGADLLARMETLTGKLDTALTQRAAPEAQAVQGLTAEISALRRDIAAGWKPAVEAIESQVQAIVQRLDTMPGPQNDDAALSQLEGQVATLAEKIDSVALRPAALDHVEANLAALEGLLRQSREESGDVARRAAREAVESLSAPAIDAAAGNLAVQGLQNDLRALQSAADDKDLQTKDTLGTVHDVLDRVSERLSMLETVSRRDPAGGNTTAGPGGRRTLRRDGAERSTLLLDRPVANRPTGQDTKPAVDSEPVLDLDRRAEAPTGRRADFIAAARRAAQAAAAESASLEEAETSGRRGPLTRIGEVFSKRRRPLLLAAAAVVLTIAALKLFAAIGDGGTVAMAKADAAPISKLAVDPAATTTRAFVQTAPQTATAADTAPVSVPATAPDQNALVALATNELPASRFAPTSAAPATRGFTAVDPSAAPVVVAPAAAASPVPDQSAPTAVVGPSPLPDVSVGPLELRKAAAAGDAAALFEVASRYADGRVVGQDLKQAANWYSEAAKRGLPIAAVRLAALYEHGTGVARDRVAAASWYQKAADAGNIRAMHNLAVLMSEGVTDQPDYVAAAGWFSKAAERGIKDSQYNLGVMYARGLGVGQDLTLAYRWFALAAAQGDTDAGGRRDDVAKSLSADQLAQARLAVQGWQATKAPDAANAEPTVKSEWTAPPQRRASADRVDLVRRVQTVLSQQGYDVGPADGLEGPKTRIAVKAVQHKLGTPETGTIDSTLLAALGEAI